MSRMKIYWIKEGLETDHSSTNYNFYSSEKELSKEERKLAERFSSRAHATKREVSFTYNGEWSDLPGGAREELLKKYFDIMVYDSYDWWTLAMAFNYNEKLFKKLKEYECRGPDDTGIDIEKIGKRIIVNINCRLDYNSGLDLTESGPKYSGYYDEYGDEEKEYCDDFSSSTRGVLIAVRKEIRKNRFSALQAVKNLYEGKPQGKNQSKAAKAIAAMISLE